MEDGKKVKRPVLDEDGHPTVANIIVPYLEENKVTLVEGVRKKVNSGSKVLMDNAIEREMSNRLRFRSLSLKEDNFDSLKFGGESIEKDVLFD